ncbi:DUF4058 family protein [Tautonia sp. JC769]|uniref:DUF4058 family protein n=1 Tax=Tautonia sp. JC769 TaxID=3232135 RepID=UPI003459F1DF
MPLRDHFRPPMDQLMSWDGVHGQWPAMIVLALSARLPKGYLAAPHIHLGSAIEVDVATFDRPEEQSEPFAGSHEGGGAATATMTATWAPPRPTLAIRADVPKADEYEVRVYDTRRGRRLVAAVELVSPSNEDRPEHRRAFVTKCAAMLAEGVCVAIVDVVTTRAVNLYGELLAMIGHADPMLGHDPPVISAASCRWMQRGGARVLESWAYPLELGKDLPILPLWLTPDLAVPLDLEASYEGTCRALRIP